MMMMHIIEGMVRSCIAQLKTYPLLFSDWSNITKCCVTSEFSYPRLNCVS